MFRTKADLFKLMNPYYQSKDVLIYQLRMAQEAYDIGLMNYAHLKKSGCLNSTQTISMQVRSALANQLTFADLFVPEWYRTLCVQQGNPIDGSLA